MTETVIAYNGEDQVKDKSSVFEPITATYLIIHDRFDASLVYAAITRQMDSYRRAIELPRDDLNNDEYVSLVTGYLATMRRLQAILNLLRKAGITDSEALGHD